MTAITAETLLEHAGWAHGLARRLVEDAATADDVVQEAWFAALRRAPSDDRPLRPWLATVIRRVAARGRRTAGRRAERERAAARDEALPSASELAGRAEGQRRLVQAVLALAEPFRETVLLRWFEGLEPAEIARRKGLPAGTVRWRSAEALKRLRAQLDDGADGDRRAWALALVPLATGKRGAAVAAGASSAILLKGLLLMKTHAFLLSTAGAAALFLWAYTGGGWFAPSGDYPVVGPSPAVAAQPEAPADSGAENAPERTVVEEPAPAAPPPSEAESAAARTLRATFVDPAGQPVRGVRLELQGPWRESVESDDQGVVLLELPASCGDSVGVRAWHRAYATVERRATVNPGTAELGTIRLDRGGSIEGIVVDEHGQPVAGADLHVEGSAPRIDAGGGMFMMGSDRVGAVHGRSAADGKFRLAGVLAQRVQLEASVGSRFSERWMEGSARVDVSAGGEASVRVEVRDCVDPAQRITLTVLDPEGAPVDGARVNIHRSGGGNASTSTRKGRLHWLGGGHRWRFVITDATGRWNPIEVSDIGPGETREVRFEEAPTFRMDVRSSEAEREIREVTLRLRQPDPSFLGRLRGERPRTFVGEHTAAADGLECRLPDARFVIDLEAFGHARKTFGPFDPAVAKSGVEVTLTARPVVTGRVVTAGRPVAGADVALHYRSQYRTVVNGFPVWLDPNAAATAKTDDAGRFELTVRDDRAFFLRASADGRAITESTELGTGAARKEQELELGQGGSISGLVRSAGADVAGTIVGASRGDGAARTVRVDADGRFRFDRLTPGRWLVRVQSREIRAGSSSSSTTPLPAPVQTPWNCEVHDDRETAFDLTLEGKPNAVLEGRIELPGRDLSGAVLQLQTATSGVGQASRHPARARIEADGSFRAERLVSGDWVARLQEGDVQLEAKVRVSSGTNRFELVPATGTVEVFGLPTGGTEIENAAFVTWQDGKTTLRIRLQPDADGRARCEGVPAGSLRIERGATPEEAGAAILAGRDPHIVEAARFQLEAGRTATVRL